MCGLSCGPLVLEDSGELNGRIAEAIDVVEPARHDVSEEVSLRLRCDTSKRCIDVERGKLWTRALLDGRLFAR